MDIEKKTTSKVYIFFDWLYKLLIMNVFTIMSLIPIVTFFPAIVAMNATVKNDMNEPGIFKNFFRNYKKYFLKSFFIGLILIAIVAIIGFAFYFYSYTIDQDVRIVIDELSKLPKESNISEAISSLETFAKNSPVDISRVLDAIKILPKEFTIEEVIKAITEMPRAGMAGKMQEMGIIVMIVMSVLILMLCVHIPLLLITFDSLSIWETIRTSFFVSFRYFISTLILLGMVILSIIGIIALPIWFLFGVSLPALLGVKFTQTVYKKFEEIDLDLILQRAEDDLDE